MDNDNFSNNIVTDNISIVDNATSLAYEWEDYSEVVAREDIIIENQNKIFELINQGFSFLSFIIVIYFLYFFIKNMIRK